MLFTFPSRYWYTIGLWRVFSLGGWSRRIHTGFHVPRATQEHRSHATDTSDTGLSPSTDRLSRLFSSRQTHASVRVLQPPGGRNLTGLGCAPFARHYWGYHCCFLFLRVLRCFSSPGLPLHEADDRSSTSRVVPFGNPRIKGHLHLPAAYRSLSRPSSPVRAKASAMCPFILSP